MHLFGRNNVGQAQVDVRWHFDSFAPVNLTWRGISLSQNFKITHSPRWLLSRR